MPVPIPEEMAASFRQQGMALGSGSIRKSIVAAEARGGVDRHANIVITDGPIAPAVDILRRNAALPGASGISAQVILGAYQHFDEAYWRAKFECSLLG